jgi:hypothetical protein
VHLIQPDPADRQPASQPPAPITAGGCAVTSGRARVVAVWTAWHVGELVVTTGLAALAMTVTWWWAIPTGLVALAWLVNEWRVWRRQRVRQSATPSATGPGPDAA